MLDVLLKQTYRDFEILVVDDGSTDATELTVLEYCNSYSFIKYEKQSNQGVCAARNTGARIANGKYLIFLDSDDSVEFNWLSDFYDLLKDNNYDVGFCNMKEINSGHQIKLINASNPYKNQQKKGKYIAGMFAIERDLFNSIGMYDEKINYGENTELGIRLRMKEVSMGFVNNYNFSYHRRIYFFHFFHL